MTLAVVIHGNTIQLRKSLLSNFLQTNECGELSELEATHFKHIFSKYYTPDEEYTKFDASSISKVSIVNDSWGKKCFSIQVDKVWYPASIQRLSGGNRNEKANIVRAMRNAVEEQIQTFRSSNPLNPDAICPITNKSLGKDAEVDHILPFHIIKDDWLRNYYNSVVYSYDLDKMNYVLQDPCCKMWQEYHFEKATLRWVSKEGNTIAHTLYTGEHSNRARA
jgi:hypothetical protein